MKKQSNWTEPGTAEAPFYIPAVNLPARPRRTLKHNDTFVVFDSHGDIGAATGGADGLFHCDTRLLSHLELHIEGAQPLLLGSAVKDDNLNYYVDLTNPDIYRDGRLELPKDTVHIGRTVYLFDGALRERIVLANHGTEPVRLTLSITFASDFADIFEVRGLRRLRRGVVTKELTGAGAVALSYEGLDGAVRRTDLAFEPAPSLLLDSTANYALSLQPHEKRVIFVAASGQGPVAGSTRSFFKGLMGLYREHKEQTRTIATVETSHDLVNEVLCRCAADLHMLATATADGWYPYAGIPWYSTTFGRDGLITAIETLWLDPSLARGVLRRLARYQATTEDPLADASRGKILHEMRGGEMAALGEIPFGLYYGSVDSTPLFVILAGLYAERTGDYELIRELWPTIEAALEWIDVSGDADRDGFIEYARGAETGLSNQGWKDSYDSVFHADGRLADGPVALVEVQGYVYAAKMYAAACARVLGRPERAEQLEAQAACLKSRFDDAFWCSEIGTYALALDGAKQQCRVRTSNAGHVLFTGIARPDHAREVAASLLGPAFFSGWGLRTVAKGAARYNPMSYHNGSVWPHDNAIIALGLARYGYRQEIGPLFEGLVRAASYMDHRRIPELFCGFDRRKGRGPTLYPAACSPQAWASGTPFLLLQAMLGLRFDAAAGRVELIDPALPAYLGDVVIRNLRLGDGSADFALRRRDGNLCLDVLETTGNMKVVMGSEAPPVS